MFNEIAMCTIYRFVYCRHNNHNYKLYEFSFERSKLQSGKKSKIHFCLYQFIFCFEIESSSIAPRGIDFQFISVKIFIPNP